MDKQDETQAVVEFTQRGSGIPKGHRICGDVKVDRSNKNNTNERRLNTGTEVSKKENI